MQFFRIVVAFAAVATLLQLAAVTLLSAQWLTLDGNTLRVVAFVVGVIVAILIPVGGAFASVRGLESRGMKPRRGPMIAGVVALFNGIALTALCYGIDSPVATAWSGGQRMVSTADTPTVEPDDGEPTTEPVKKAPKATPTVEKAKKTVGAVLQGTAPADHLTDETAAAIGALWMGFLDENWPDLESRVGPETWTAIHQGLPDQPDLWSDPAAIETDLVKRGRPFLAAVSEAADTVNAGTDPGRLTWPVLPKSVLTAAVQGDALDDARFEEVALNRVEVRLSNVRWDLRYEDGAWRLHLGDYGDLATRRIAPATLLIALGR